MNTTFTIAKDSKQISGIKKGQNFLKADIGKFEEAGAFISENKDLNLKNQGKIFFHDLLELSGAEISLSSIPANTNAPFKHKHNKNEEIYIILKGKGNMETDNEIIDVKEGSFIKIKPEGIRALNNTNDEEMIVLCIQVKENSLNGFTLTDAKIV